MKFLIEEFVHSFYVTIDTPANSDIREINYVVSAPEGESGKVTIQKATFFKAKNINEAILKMEEVFEFENDKVKEDAFKPLMEHFSDNKS